jgi:hypothetical protein
MAAIPVAALTDGSGTITSGGAAQTAAPANPGRQYLLLQNVSDTTMWVNIGVTAVANQPSIQVVAGAALEFSAGGTGVVPTGLISVIGATTGKAFTLKTA